MRQMAPWLLALSACAPTMPQRAPAPEVPAEEPAPTDASGDGEGTATVGHEVSVEDEPPLPALPIERRCNVTGEADAFERPALRRMRGRVSYYHDSLHGRSTASGEPYDRHALTAASRDLPFGTVVRIRRIDRHAEGVVVRINDRGPFGRNQRILDLSRAAAQCLDMIRAGVVTVEADILVLGDGRRVRR